MNKRTPTKVRKEEILAAAIEIAKVSGLAAVSGKKIAAALGVGRTGVMYHIISMHDLRCDVMRIAIETEELAVIAQGLAVGDPIAQEAPEALRRRAVEMLV
jgi:AcrR family transcriptional regulator